MKAILIFCLFTLALYSNDKFKLNGFASLGLSYNDNKNMTYRSDLVSLVGSKNKTSGKPLNTLGLQLDYIHTNNLSATVQALYKERKYQDITLEWANIKYSLDNSDYGRIGIMRIPLFMYSDILYVSYAYPWAHLPNEVYTSMVSNYSGIEYTKNFYYDDYDFSAQFMYGDRKNNEQIGFQKDFLVNIDIKDIKGLAFNANYNNLKFRASYFDGIVTINHITGDFTEKFYKTYNLPIPGIGTVPVKFSDNTVKYLDEKYAIKNEKITFSGLGFNYDNEFILSSEYTKISISENAFVKDLTGWYVNLGYRYESFLPYIIYAQRDQTQASSDETLTGNQYEQILYDEGVKSNVNKLIEKSNIAQKSISLGTKYNFSSTTSLKFQYEKILIDDSHRSIHINNNNNSKKDLNVYHFSVNVVF